MTAARLWPAGVAASTAAAVAATALALPNPGRAVLVFWFLLACPGLAIVPLFGVRRRTTELMLAVAASLVLDTLVAETMVLAKLWSPTAGLAILAALSFGGAAYQLKRRERDVPVSPVAADPEHHAYLLALRRYINAGGHPPPELDPVARDA